MLDTGLRTRGGDPEHPALTNCLVHDVWLNRGETGRFDDEDEPDDDGRGQLDTQGGHGTFISGIIRQHCPDAVVHHSGVLTSYGDGDHASIAHAVERALSRAGDGYDIVVMALGTYAVGDDATALGEIVDRLLAARVVVASAGNDGTSRPYFPPRSRGRRRRRAHGQGRAAFSNFGSWVDACAPGVDVVSTFFSDFDDVDADRAASTTTAVGRGGAARASPPRGRRSDRPRAVPRRQHAGEAWLRMSRGSPFRLPELGQVFNV